MKIIDRLSKTNIKAVLFDNKYHLYYCHPDKSLEKCYSAQNKKEIQKAWLLLRSLFIMFNHASYLRSEKDLMDDDHSLFKGYYRTFMDLS